MRDVAADLAHAELLHARRRISHRRSSTSLRVAVALDDAGRLQARRSVVVPRTQTGVFQVPGQAQQVEGGGGGDQLGQRGRIDRLLRLPRQARRPLTAPASCTRTTSHRAAAWRGSGAVSTSAGRRGGGRDGGENEQRQHGRESVSGRQGHRHVVDDRTGVQPSGIEQGPRLGGCPACSPSTPRPTWPASPCAMAPATVSESAGGRPGLGAADPRAAGPAGRGRLEIDQLDAIAFGRGPVPSPGCAPRPRWPRARLGAGKPVRADR